MVRGDIGRDFDFSLPAIPIERDRMLSNLAFQNRKILLYDDIGDDSIFRCIYTLMRIREADKSVGTKAPIEICINSRGGAVHDGLSLISLIESMKDEGYEITTTNMGYAYSMGFLISIVGTHRHAYRYADYLWHDVSSISVGKMESMLEDIESLKKLRDIVNGIVKKYTNLTEDDLKDIYDRKLDKTYSAKEAQELNICDEVV